MVNLTRIYTRTGDRGTTNLGDMSRVPKTDLRISADAEANGANAVMGTAIALGDLDAEVVKVLTRVQNDLFDVGADLSTPVVENPKFPPLRVEQFYVDRLEADCDRFNAELEKLRSFILHGGTAGRAVDLGGPGGARRDDEPAHRDLPEPPVRPAVHPGPHREQDHGGRPVGAGRGALSFSSRRRSRPGRRRPRRTRPRSPSSASPGIRRACRRWRASSGTPRRGGRSPRRAP